MPATPEPPDPELRALRAQRTRRGLLAGATATLAMAAGAWAVHSPAVSAAPSGSDAGAIEPPRPYRELERIDPPPAAPIDDEETAAEPLDPAEPDPRLEPATKAAARILALQEEIRATLTHTTYQHRTVIRPKEGVYLWDCSGMAAWFLRKAAPRARKAMSKGRPVARDFYRQIAKAPTRRARNGWQRLPSIEAVRPGDMFAWQRPPGFPSRNTGHVGFALAPAEPVPEIPGAYTLRIFDATSLPHQDDTRTREDGGGIGEGTILFLTDEEGGGIAYGWFGARSRGVIVTEIAFGRLSR